MATDHEPVDKANASDVESNEEAAAAKAAQEAISEVRLAAGGCACLAKYLGAGAAAATVVALLPGVCLRFFRAVPGRWPGWTGPAHVCAQCAIPFALAIPSSFCRWVPLQRLV